MRFFGRGLRATTLSNNHGGLTTFSDCATRSIGDYLLSIVDEVALEGLDGISLQALWIRLQGRSDFSFKLETQKEREWVFSILVEQARQSRNKNNEDIQFYWEKTPRIPLVVYNRYDHTDG